MRARPRSALALYERGQELLREQKQARGAARAFEEYRQRFPEAPLIQEAWFSLIEAHLMKFSYSEALRESEAFLRRFPESERRSRVQLLAANVERELGDCHSAVARYDALIEGGGAEADDAAYFAALCAERGGHQRQALQRLDEYLLLFPNGRHRAEAIRVREGRR
jgi:outer membrane protein assembly factor BamD (BamD/ComL family)